MNVENVKHIHKSVCRNCGKLLSKPEIRLESDTLPRNEFLKSVVEFLKNINIYYGAQVKCRRCKNMSESMTKLK